MSDQARKTGKVVQPYGLQPPLPRTIKTSPPYSGSSLEPTPFTLMHKPNPAYNDPVAFQNWNEGLGSGYAALPHYFINESNESSDGSVVNSSSPSITQAPLHVLDSFAQAFTQNNLRSPTQMVPQSMLSHAPAQRDHTGIMRHVHPVLQHQQQQQQHIASILQDALPPHHGGMYQTLHKAGVPENWQRGWRHEDTQEVMVPEQHQPCFGALQRIVEQRAIPVDNIRSCFSGPLTGDKLMVMQQQMPQMHGQFQRQQPVQQIVPHMQQQQQQPQQPIHGLRHPHLSSVQVSGGVITENQVAVLADASVQRLATPPLAEISSSHDTLQHRVTPPILSTPTSSVSSGTGLEKQDQPLSPVDKESFHHRDQAPFVLPVSVPVTPKSSEAGGALSQAEEQRGSSRTCDAQGRNSDDEMPVLDKATPTVPSSWNHIPRKSELLRKRSLPAKWPRRPDPLIIPPPLSIASSYPGATLYQSQLRSPCIASGETARLPLYTPPPMLSPVRQGSGLYFSGVLSSSHGHSSETLAPTIAPSLTPRIILNKPGSGEGLKVPVDSEDAQVSISPHINIGVAFQADIPVLQWRDHVALDKHLATLVWAPRSVTKDKEVDVLLNLACSSAVPGGGMNIELALHVLHEEKGDLKAALEFLLLQEANRPSSHPLADYHYSGSAYWSPNDKKLFEQSLTSHGKDFFMVCKMMKTKTMAQCIEYYYTWKAMIRCSRHRTRQGIAGNDGMGLGEKYDDDDDDDDEEEDALIRRDGRRSASFGPMSDDEDRGHSRESPPELELQLATFVCNFPQCGIVFSSRQALNGHIRIHRGYNVDLLASTALRRNTPANSVFMKPSASKPHSEVMDFPHRPPPFGDQNMQPPLKQPKVVGAQVATTPRSRSNAGQKAKGPPGLGHGTLGPEGTVIFPCKECGKVFHKVKSRNAHMKSHRQQEEQQRQAARRVAALVADTPQIPAKTLAAAQLGHPTTSARHLNPPQPQRARQPQRFGWDTEDEDRVRQSHRERGRPLVDPWCDDFMESDLVIDEELG
uniref:transcriptional-regulating factor 1-like isoform X2 n=1 Tax=Myxine glutinosa TaxID=7769 RepID=UPI00358EB746